MDLVFVLVYRVGGIGVSFGPVLYRPGRRIDITDLMSKPASCWFGSPGLALPLYLLDRPRVGPIEGSVHPNPSIRAGFGRFGKEGIGALGLYFGSASCRSGGRTRR
jgi:hypothetical protein